MKASALGTAILSAMQEYTDEVARGVVIEVDEMADVVRDEIADGSPEKTGDYRKGWKVKKADSPGRTRRIVHNKTDWQLTHLLEKGHVKRGGVGRVAGHPHIAPVCDRRLPELLDRIKRVVKNGGPL